MPSRAREQGEFFPDIPWWTDAKESTRIVADLIQRTPTVIAPTAEVQYAARLASGLGAHHLPVVSDAGAPLGVICLCEIRPHAVVSDCMSSPAVTIDVEESVDDAAGLMRDLHLGCLPVIENGRVVGMLTRGDLRRAGALDEADCPHCATCFSYHHVRRVPGTQMQLCVKCLVQTQPWAIDDDDDDFWGAD